jgi:hypothetical protein
MSAETNQWKEPTVLSLPAAAEPLVQAIEQDRVFTRPTFQRFLILMIGLIVTMGRHTVSHALAAVGPLLDGHWSNYHRLWSWAKYSMWKLAAVLVRQVVALLPEDAVIELVADDTVDGKDGDRVWAKAGHYDSAGSTRSKTAIKFGHRWLAMCVLVQLPGWDRPWALPILCGLCVSPKLSKRIGVRPKTPSQLARQLLIRLMRWLPGRRFVLTGDYLVVTHQTVAFAQRHADRVTVIGRLRGDANLYAAPKHPGRRCRGGTRSKKGRKLPTPQRRIAQLQPTHESVTWYGSSRRKLRCVSEAALWHDKHGSTVTPIRWVCVLGDPRQNLLDAFFFSSDPAMTAPSIIEHYARRWNIEVTFEEARSLLGLETTRHWCRQSVLRVTPMLLGLFSAIVLIWQRLPRSRQACSTSTPCYCKHTITFADVLAAVRRELWETVLLGHREKSGCLNRLSPSERQIILWHLTAAA